MGMAALGGQERRMKQGKSSLSSVCNEGKHLPRSEKKIQIRPRKGT
jgi:hypothetical protein